MKRDEALKATETALDELARALEQGQSENLTAYLQTLARFHRYSFTNVLLIAHQRPEATYVAGFHAWLKLGRHVRKGETGIGIIAPMVGRRQEDRDENSIDTAANEGRPSLYGFKVVHVFDVSQTDGKPLPEFADVRGTPGDNLDALRSLVAGHGIRLDYAAIPGGALGVSVGGVITVVPGLCPAEEFSVLAHELAHELLHQGDRRAETTKTIRETEAEAVAFVVCHAFGIESTAHSTDYIRLYRGDRETLARSLEHVQRTASSMIEGLRSGA